MIQVGDKVWALRDDPKPWSSNPADHPPEVWVRADVEEIGEPGLSPSYIVRFADGRVAERRAWSGTPSPIKPFDAIDHLADIVRCEVCADYGEDKCPQHHHATFTIKASVRGNGDGAFETYTLPNIGSASTADPITALGDLVRSRRRPLPAREKTRRRAARKRARASKQRNR